MCLFLLGANVTPDDNHEEDKENSCAAVAAAKKSDEDLKRRRTRRLMSPSSVFSKVEVEPKPKSRKINNKVLSELQPSSASSSAWAAPGKE